MQGKDTTLNRLIVTLVFAPLVATLASGSMAGAQPSGVLGVDPRLAAYPRLTIRLSEERIEAPSSVAAGPTVLVQEQSETGVGHAFVFRVSDDVAEFSVVEGLQGGPAAEETPEWFWRAEFVGNGNRAAADRPAIAMVDLNPGRYIVGVSYRPASKYARCDVIEPANVGAEFAERPVGDIDGELFEMGFRSPANLEPRRSFWEIRNMGGMLHEIAILPIPVDVSASQVKAAASSKMEVELGGGDAAARKKIDALGDAWTDWASRPVAGVGVLSPQRVSRGQIDLVAGTYAAVRYTPDPAIGTPHLMLGMTAVFTVEPGIA